MGMKTNTYLIEFNKLQHGLNDYEFDINDEFLSEFEFSTIKTAEIKAITSVTKSENILEFEIHLEGNALVPCDICLSEINLPIDEYFDFKIKMSEENNFDDPEIIYLNRNEISYDLKQFLYESVLLSLPNVKNCDEIEEPKPCDQTVLNKIQSKIESTDNESEDPRWEKLKDIIK
jgi:uncharacterized metal-binding protein YceD (DUF177 family)